MAQVRLLKIGTDGVPTENANADDVTFTSFTVFGGGPVLSATGLDMNNTDISDIQDLVFFAPATATINQTAGLLLIDNIMAKDRDNLMTTAGSVLFPIISDTAGQVDAFRLPSLAGVPTATPTAGGEGEVVWDSTGDKIYVWNGTAWVDTTSSNDKLYTAEVTLTASQAVYISSADNVSPAQGLSTSASYMIGFAVTGAAAAAPVYVRSDGLLAGFTGLTAGARYYVSPSSAGSVTATVPVGSGNTIVQAGYAKNATTMDIEIEQLGRRA